MNCSDMTSFLNKKSVANIILALHCFLLSVGMGWATEYTILQLTENDYDDNSPQLQNGQVAWYGYDGHDWEIFFYDGTNVIQVTQNDYDDNSPQLQNGRVAWYGYDDNDQAIFLYDGSNIIQVTEFEDYEYGYDESNFRLHNGQIVWEACPLTWEIFLYDGIQVMQLSGDESVNWADVCPQIHNGQVVWHGYVSSSGSYEIFLYDGAKIIQLTYAEKEFDDQMYPDIQNGQVAWYGFDGHDWEIFFYDGISEIQVTEDDRDDFMPQIDNGQIVWLSDGDNNEIGFYDGFQVIRLGEKYDAYWPQLHDGKVSWIGFNGTDYEVFFYDGTKTVQLTKNKYNDSSPQIHNGQVVWAQYDGHDNEIFLYDGSKTVQLTKNEYDDSSPQIHNGQVAWMGFDGNDYEIFLASPILVPEGLDYIVVTPEEANVLAGDTLEFTAEGWGKGPDDKEGTEDDVGPFAVIAEWSIGKIDIGSVSPSSGDTTTFTAIDELPEKKGQLAGHVCATAVNQYGEKIEAKAAITVEVPEVYAYVWGSAKQPFSDEPIELNIGDETTLSCEGKWWWGSWEFDWTVPSEVSLTTVEETDRMSKKKATFNALGSFDVTVTAKAMLGAFTFWQKAFTQKFLVKPELHHFDVEAPDDIVSGEAFTVTITARDELGNTVEDYEGTVHFTSDDKADGVALPSDFTFALADKGTHLFGDAIVLRTVEKTGAYTRTIEVEDIDVKTVKGSAEVIMWFGVKSTYESFEQYSVKTATAPHGFDEPTAFAALPAGEVKWHRIKVQYEAKVIDTQILDVGPWYPAPKMGPSDPYWRTTGVPRAETDPRTNQAGIDLSDVLCENLGFTPGLNPIVLWRFE